MSSLHPGLILILTGIIACLVPMFVRRVVLIAGPALALIALFMLGNGTVWTIPFINDYELYLLHVDVLSWVFGLIFCMIALIGNIYALHNKSRGEALAAMLYAGSALSVTLCGDWLTLIFFWELMAGSSLFLIWLNKTEASTKAGFRYLLVHMLGGNLLLFGIIFKVTGGDPMVANIAATHDAAFWLILIGVAINCAIPPLHGWMVDAYPEGTLTGTIFMNSYTSKVAVYCLIRIFAGTELLLWAGVIMALYGALFAIIENDMRRLLSYHIVSQVGFMVAGVGIGTGLALNGAAAHTFSNILFKSLLFMCAGAIIYSTGIRKINQLGGLHKKMPFVFVCFAIAALAIAGVPFLNGFITKSLITTAAHDAGYPLAELLLQLAGIGTLLSIVAKMGYFIFFGEDKGAEVKKPVPKNMYVAMAIIAVLCVIYGCFPDLLYRFLPYEFEYHPYTIDHIVQYVQLLLAGILPFMLYLAHMEPHSQLSLDFDWFYRKPFKALISAISSICVAIQVSTGKFFKGTYDGSRRAMGNPMKFIGQRPREMEHVDGAHAPDEYNPDAYRAAESEIIVIALIVLLLAMLFIAI